MKNFYIRIVKIVKNLEQIKFFPGSGLLKDTHPWHVQLDLMKFYIENKGMITVILLSIQVL